MQFDPKKGIKGDLRSEYREKKGSEIQLIQYDIKDYIVNGELMITNI